MEQISFFNEPHLKIDKPIRLIELFAGIGAQAKALENIGADFEHYRVCEFDEHAVRSYNAIHGTSFEPSDITKLHASDLNIVDTDKYCYILCYSFPCQDLSSAGTKKGMQKGTGSRSSLLWEVERLLEETENLPQILLMENVPEVVTVYEFSQWCEYLRSKGYTNRWQTMNANDYGIPQSRERCLMVSWLGDYIYNFPEPVPLIKKFRDMLDKEVDEKYYLTGEQVDKFLKTANVERERERESCHTIRCGGGHSYDRSHAWDIVLVHRQHR